MPGETIDTANPPFVVWISMPGATISKVTTEKELLELFDFDYKGVRYDLKQWWRLNNGKPLREWKSPFPEKA